VVAISICKGIIMINRWVIAFAVLGVIAAPLMQRTIQGQPPAAVPAWVPPPAPAPPLTLWRFLGIPQGFQRIGDARLNRNGNFPGLERKPPLKPIAHPDNLLSNNPAIKKAAEIKMQEDLAKQKIKAIKYLAELGCDKCYGGVKEAMLAALDDCTEQVRYEAAKALGEAAVQHCDVCSRQCCCDEELTKKLAQVVYELDDKGCPIEPSERVREAAREALKACCPNVGPPGYAPEVINPETPPETPPELPPETPPEVPPELPPPAGQNGVAPRSDNVLPEASVPPTPNVRPSPLTSAGTGMFLGSRAHRMAATARARRGVTPTAAAQKRPVVSHVIPRSSMPATVAQNIVPQNAAVPQTQNAVVVTDHGATLATPDAQQAVTVSDAGPTAGDLRIRVSDQSASTVATAAPSRTAPPQSNRAENSVRIRDGESDLQLASVSEAIADDSLFAPPTVGLQNTSSRRHASTAGGRPEAIQSVEQSPTSATRPAVTYPMSHERVTAVHSVRPQVQSSQARGRVTGIDTRSGTVQLTFPADQLPAKGALVKTYHRFLLGEDCVGALEVVSVRNNMATARPVGNLSLTKLALDDQVAYQAASSPTSGEPFVAGAASVSDATGR
jgi:hypothetical protein